MFFVLLIQFRVMQFHTTSKKMGFQRLPHWKQTSV